ncbi:DUF4101 domain-containing protein [Nostoc punctiforme FACHB-252]|uniref:DUF4101 domain-containing protein n=1 Tax=Nostoc punctiforme FACHB-252 TaxID=1357509 RepID=A0ABR8HKF7_NOSPU|nr:IMS domain-containing protein [Nostoc punctiforme]MBD2616314.1 DUF4101 domain-containing protein [Nostoc punctiforme FACHB-252]
MQNSKNNSSHTSQNNSWLIPLSKAYHLLPAAWIQRKERKDALKFVLHKWKNNSVKEKEITLISKRLQLLLFLTDWGWLIALFLLLIGYMAINYIKHLQQEINVSHDCVTEKKCIILLESANVEAWPPNLNMGELTVKFRANGTSNDYLGIRNQDINYSEIGIDGSNVTYKGAVIGSFDGGQGTKPLIVKFNTNVTKEVALFLVRNIIYQNTHQSSIIGSRQVEFKITDGQGGVSKPFVIKIQDQSPILTVPNSQSFKENTYSPINGIRLAVSNRKVTVTLETINGTITVKPDVVQGLTEKGIINNQSQKVTLTGTINEINTTLAASQAINYQGNKDDTLTVTVSDTEKVVLWPATDFKNNELETKTINIKVIPINPPPVITIPNNQSTYQDSNLPIKGISLSDPNHQDITVTLEVTNGFLAIKSDVLNGLTAEKISNNKTQKVTLKGNTAKINSSLAEVIYRGSPNYAGEDNLIITASDGTKTAQGTINITVKYNPVISLPSSPTPSPTPSPTASPTPLNGDVQTKEAVNLINSWLIAKSQAFGNPPNSKILDQYTTGEYLTKQQGTVDYLIEKNAYYQYNSPPKIEPLGALFQQGNQVFIDVKVSENTTLFVNGRIVPDQTGVFSNEYRWFLQLENGSWKIARTEKK